MSDGLTEKNIQSAETAGKAAVDTAKDLLNERETASPPKQIHELRKYFGEILKIAKATLVVLIDDLDRCLPATAIATLEAIRLFLFLEHTAFVIAADDKMIRQYVKSHFKGIELDDDLVTNYFDKLIQVPIRVPPLGTQDVRAYLMLLFIENSTLKAEDKEKIRDEVCKQLSKSWQGKRVDRAFVMGQIHNCPDRLKTEIEIADRLAPLMATSSKIGGNPRLIKRFLNTLEIRLAIARGQGVTVDESALAKMLLFERCGDADAYSELVMAINESAEGKPRFLKPIETSVLKGEELKDLKAAWDNSFVRQWLALEPPMAELDLRAVVYVSREHLPTYTALDELSSKGNETLAGLFALTTHVNEALGKNVQALSKREITLLMDKILAKAKQVQKWGTPPILFSALTVAKVDPDSGSSLARFLKSLPVTQLEPSIIPLIQDYPWAVDVFSIWNGNTSTPTVVKKAITGLQRKGT